MATLRSMVSEALGLAMNETSNQIEWNQYSQSIQISKGEQTMNQQTELLPKDILVDLSEGDRSSTWLEVERSDEIANQMQQAQSLGQAFNAGNQLSNQMRFNSGSSFMSSAVMDNLGRISTSSW